MFSFLNASILVGLGTIALPLIIHLITRQKAKKIYFSSLIFLKELKTQKIRRIKIRQILLLLIRTLIILLLILAFARPTLKGKFSSAIQSQAKTSAVIILDNSLSMAREYKRQLLFEKAKEKVKALSDLFKFGDEIFALYLTLETPPIYEGPRYDFRNITQLISATHISYGSTDIVSAIVEAKKLLQHSQNLNKEIYLISDLQKTGFDKLQEISAAILEKTNIRLYVIPCTTGEISNLGIVNVESANQIIEKGKVFELDVLIKNHGNFEERNKLIQLFIEGKRSAQSTINLKQGDSQKITFKIIPDKTGLLTGTVLLEDDDLLLDNRRFFTFYVPEKINVLLIGKDATDTKFLKLAGEISSNIDMVEANRSQVSYGALNEFDVIILSNIPQLDDMLISTLYGYVEQGKGLIVFLGGDVDLKNYNKNLNQKFSLPIFTETIGNIDNRNSFLTFGKVELSHPIFKGMFEETPEQIESPDFYFAVKAKENIHSEDIIKLSNNEPFLSENQIGKGKVLLFLTAINSLWSNFHLQGIFAPLINRSIIYLAGVAEHQNDEIFVDQEIKKSVQLTGGFIDFKIVRPDGSIEKIKPQLNEGTYNINFRQTDLPGIYMLYSNDKQLKKWAINSWPMESNIELFPEKKIRELIGKDNLTYINDWRNIKDAVLTARYGRELWKFFIAASLFLLFVEMIIARESKAAEFMK